MNGSPRRLAVRTGTRPDPVTSWPTSRPRHPNTSGTQRPPARAALPAWAATPAPARGEILFRAAALLAERAEAIGRDLAREEGKTLAEGIAETRRASAILRYFAGQTSEPMGEVYASATPGTRLFTQRIPVGVVAVITPWNFPIAIPAWKVAPALAFGNTVLFKPASHTPLVGNHLVTALVDAGLPPGVIGMVFTDGDMIEREWIRPGAVDAISFTGSGLVGRRLQAAALESHATGAAGAGWQEQRHRDARRGHRPRGRPHRPWIDGVRGTEVHLDRECHLRRRRT